MIYGSVNQVVLSHIPRAANRLLDIGCGTGALGKKIKEMNKAEVIGITFSKDEAELASKDLDRVLIADLNHFNPDLTGKFDCIVCSHVLEHLYDPQKLLKILHNYLTPQGILVVALPNILFWKQRLQFLRGHFKYTEGGLMDRTHFRFFDWETAHTLLEKSGYSIKEAQADGALPLPGFRQVLPSLSTLMDHAAVKRFPGLFGFQFIFVCSLSSIKKS